MEGKPHQYITIKPSNKYSKRLLNHPANIEQHNHYKKNKVRGQGEWMGTDIYLRSGIKKVRKNSSY